MRALLPSDPLARHACLLTLLAFLGAYLIHAYVRRPRLQRAEALALRIDELASRRPRDGAGLAGEDPEARADLHAAHLARLERLVPTNQDVATLLSEVSAEARRTGVEIATLRPGPREPAGAHESWSFQVVARGSYHQIASFITAIASLERIMVPSEVAIGADPTPPPTPPTPTPPGAASPLAASFQIHTHVLRGPRAHAAPEHPAPPGGPVYERETFAYTARQRDPFVAPMRSGPPRTVADGARLLGIIHHDRPDLGVVLLGDVRAGAEHVDSTGRGARAPGTVRLRLGQTLGDMRVAQIHSDHIVLEADTPDGVVRRMLRISRTNERNPS